MPGAEHAPRPDDRRRTADCRHPPLRPQCARRCRHDGRGMRDADIDNGGCHPAGRLGRRPDGCEVHALEFRGLARIGMGVPTRCTIVSLSRSALATDAASSASPSTPVAMAHAGKRSPPCEHAHSMSPRRQIADLALADVSRPACHRMSRASVAMLLPDRVFVFVFVFDPVAPSPDGSGFHREFANGQ
jgi:hypothetical protein